MKEAIAAFRQVASSADFREMERLRSRARHNEAAALSHARSEGRSEGEKIGAEQERDKWQGVVDEQAALIAQLQTKLGIDK